MCYTSHTWIMYVLGSFHKRVMSHACMCRITHTSMHTSHTCVIQNMRVVNCVYSWVMSHAWIRFTSHTWMYYISHTCMRYTSHTWMMRNIRVFGMRFTSHTRMCDISHTWMWHTSHTWMMRNIRVFGMRCTFTSLTWKCYISLTWMRYTSHTWTMRNMHLSRCVYKWVMSHARMMHAQDSSMNTWLIAHLELISCLHREEHARLQMFLWVSRITRKNDSCIHTYERCSPRGHSVSAQRISHVSRMI